jgi:hypothetical protein
MKQKRKENKKFAQVFSGQLNELNELKAATIIWALSKNKSAE